MTDRLGRRGGGNGTASNGRGKGGVRMAALDLGTNNCRLLIAEPRDRIFEVVDSFSKITRLGEGLAISGELGAAAMNRTLSALRVCKRIMDRNHVDVARCVTTEACRRAKNGDYFVNRVRDCTGIELEVLSHDEEARLAMLGCLPLVDDQAEHLLMVDIGGGSTEVMWLDRSARNGKSDYTLSLPLGVVTLSESFASNRAHAHYDDMDDSVRSAMISRIKDNGDFPKLNGSQMQMLGTSGTVTTLAAVHLGLKRYDRRKVDGVQLPYSAIENVARQLRTLDNGARAAHPCIGNGRADLVVAGCAILDAVHECWPVTTLRVADRGVREGILNAFMGQSLDQLMWAASD